ncbi:hypothetical protein [Actinoallomurus acaciae]|uniref:Uncharacterized protein n=1 Tax=Actinoallomurus acaciae TaxID=502577 RepID=A0ABV5Y7Z7_9ACTN
MADLSFATAITAAAPEQLLHIEDEAGYSGLFSDVDDLAGALIAAALSGNKIISITPGPRGQKNRDLLTFAMVAEPQRAFIDKSFSLSAQQARGAWFLPEQASLKPVTMNMPAYLQHHPMHAITAAGHDVARLHLASTPDALATWALFIALFDTLMAPITERAAGSVQSAETQQQTWNAILDAYRRLGIQIDPAISLFAYRGGWTSLDRNGQIQARVALLDRLTNHDPRQIAARFRADRIRTLAAKTVKKSRSGTPLARQVLTRSLQPTLAAYFGGDWLAFLDYLQLPPNANEEIVTALPKPKLYVGGSAKAATAAAEHGLEVEDVQAMLAAFTGQGGPVSPVERRVEVLTRWWNQFDTIHARQATGMPSLWGLVEDGLYSIGYGPGPVPRLYRKLLTPELVSEVNELWDGITLPRWPETIVSEPYPHKLMAETLGPALTFWHGVALTAWYVCEGPSSRTPLTGLGSYHERDLTALADAKTPIHPSLFDELAQAERYLGPPEDLESYTHELPLPDGHIGIRVTGGGQRRAGFEILRDIITRHRRGWTRRYLAEYLYYRWNHELTTAARELHRFLAAKGKAPTFRQFARFATPAANHWFNGDLTALYTAVGEKAPAVTRRVDLLPIDAHDFVDAVYARLGGQRYDELLRITDFPAANRFRQQSRLAAASVYFLQIAEALGRIPEAAEFGANRFEWEWAGGLDKGWPIYQHTIEQILTKTHD